MLLYCFGGQKNSKRVNRQDTCNKTPQTVLEVGKNENLFCSLEQKWHRPSSYAPERKNPMSLDDSAKFPFGSWFRVGWCDLQAMLYNLWHIWTANLTGFWHHSFSIPRWTGSWFWAGFPMGKFLSWKINELVYFYWFQFNYCPNNSCWSWILQLIIW